MHGVVMCGPCTAGICSLLSAAAVAQQAVHRQWTTAGLKDMLAYGNTAAAQPCQDGCGCYSPVDTDLQALRGHCRSPAVCSVVCLHLHLPP